MIEQSPEKIEHILVKASTPGSHDGVLFAGHLQYKCKLGRSGIRAHKTEGDGATPAGTFPLRHVFYRGDRLGPIATDLPCSEIGESDGWCDEPDDPLYNRKVILPHSSSTERMWRDDNQYDVVVVLGHNDDPVVPRKGSAIFLHVKNSNGNATAGCIALTRDEILNVLRIVRSDCTLEIQD